MPPKTPPNNDEDARLQAELSRLQQDMKQAIGENTPPPEPQTQGEAMGKAMYIMIEFLVPIGVGGFIGYHLDRWLALSPVMMVIFILLGFGAGIRSVIRAATPPS
jgi:ATP synthase protein I